MDGDHPEENILSWCQVSKASAQSDQALLQRRVESQSPDSVATLVYTSGTTSEPKAVMLTHRNLTWISRVAAEQEFSLTQQDILISYLHLSHVAEQIVTIHSAFSGTSVCFVKALINLVRT